MTLKSYYVEKCCNFVVLNKPHIIMAKPIKETPELYGKDAERFEKLISQSRSASQKEKERARRAYEEMKSISNFQW